MVSAQSGQILESSTLLFVSPSIAAGKTSSKDSFSAFALAFSGITVVVILAILGFLAPKVGYRWFDCFFAAIPIYGLFFIFRIAHRIAFLPSKDWTERVESA